MYPKIDSCCIQYILLAALLLLGCNNQESSVPQKEELPERIDTLQNLTVFSPDEQTPDTVELVREQVFESNEEVYIQGYTGDVAVDSQNRVYVKGFIPGTAGIYVFEPDGSYITTIGRHGKGPGEFLTIAGMKIRGEKLYVYDNHQWRISVFSLDDFSISEEMLLSDDKVISEEEWAAKRPSGSFYVREDSTFIMEFSQGIRSNEYRDSYYYKLSKEGEILPGKILEFQKPTLYEPDSGTTPEGYIRIPLSMPFSRSTVIAISGDGPIYTARTEDFLIKVYDEDGSYRRAIYYPYKKSILSLSDVDLGDSRNNLARENPELVPDTWPAIHTMEIDNENRLWVSTITDSDSTFQWWVLDEGGELLARFEWPGNRSSRSIISKPMYVIKNGYFYTRERYIPAGIDRIIKHKIVFREQ